MPNRETTKKPADGGAARATDTALSAAEKHRRYLFPCVTTYYDEGMTNTGRPGGVQIDGINDDVGNIDSNPVTGNSYFDVTDQARRLPVALVFIVDQEHIDRVQAAVIKSELRFLTTQVLLNRYPHSMRPAAMGEAKAVSVAWCQPYSRMPGRPISHRRISTS